MPRLLFALLLTVVLLPASGAAGAATSESHCDWTLGSWQPGASSSRAFYYGGEDTDAAFGVQRISEGCTTSTVDVTVDVRVPAGGTSLAEEGPSGDFNFPRRSETVSVAEGGALFPVALSGDGNPEPFIETAEVVLEAVEGGHRASPNVVPLFIIDADGGTRVGFQSATFIQNETISQVKIPVFRAGTAGPISVPFTIGPGPAPAATEGADYTPPASTTLSFAAGERVKLISFTIANDSLHEEDETIQVSLTDGVDYDLASPGTMTITILDNDSDSVPPVTKFHHPRDGWTYPFGDDRLREMHVFGKDEGGAGIVMIQMALRKKKTDGSCRWWNATARGWEAGGCLDVPEDQRWMDMEDLSPWTPTWPWFFAHDFPSLRPSMGTAIRNYTAWSRGIDGAGNVESSFVKGRNWNTFEVAKP